MSLKEKDLLRELIRIPSVNPHFGDVQSQGDGEAKLSDFLTNFFDMNGWPWLRQAVHPGRDNLVALCPGRLADTMLWEAHQDTVGVEGMQIDPFAGTEQDGRIWGRGACDVKGGMAAMLTALSRLQVRPAHERPTIVLALTVNEECGFTGAKALAKIWSPGDLSVDSHTISGPLPLKELQALRPQRAIIAEPTDLNVVVAHKGVVRWRCHTHGRAAHTSRPEQGVNAIYAMAEVIRAVERFQKDVLARRPAHPLSGGPSVCVSTVHGGTGVNTVPDLVMIDIDRRIASDEKAKHAYEESIVYVAKNAAIGAATIQHEPPWLESEGLDDTHNHAWAEQLATTVRAAGTPCNIVGEPYATNAAEIAACGIPTVVFGPGSIAQAHTVDEWIDISQFTRASDVFCRLAEP